MLIVLGIVVAIVGGIVYRTYRGAQDIIFRGYREGRERSQSLVDHEKISEALHMEIIYAAGNHISGNHIQAGVHEGRAVAFEARLRDLGVQLSRRDVMKARHGIGLKVAERQIEIQRTCAMFGGIDSPTGRRYIQEMTMEHVA